MTRIYLRFGVIAAILFIGGTSLLAMGVEGYSQLAMPVSEIGRIGSVMQEPFEIVLLLVGISILIMAVGIDAHFKSENRNPVLALFVFAFSVSVIGMATFPVPHPLHKLFGLTCLIGYLSPLVYTLTAPRSQQLFRLLSWVAFALIVAFALAGFLSSSTRPLVPLEFNGLVQRGLLFTFYIWLAGLSLTLMRGAKDQSNPSTALGMA